MQNSLAKTLQRYSFWLSVLLHLLLLLSFIVVIVIHPEPEQDQEKKHPHYYVPAYTYSAKSASSSALRSASKKNVQSTRQEMTKLSSKRGIEKLAKLSEKTNTTSSHTPTLSDLLNPGPVELTKSEQPVYMIGDESEATDPLIRLLAQALSAHFEYPHAAGMFGITGVVLVGFTLHPDGHFTGVQVVKSSSNDDLDSAALYAVNEAPHDSDVGLYLKQPKHMVVGFVFRQM